jgi:CxxC-x17-CxxC domain-containing protein
MAYKGNPNRDRNFRGGNSRGGGNFRRYPTQMHKINCSDCGKEAEVPFKPKEDRPVYCRDCFIKRKEAERKGEPLPEPEKKESAKEEKQEQPKQEKVEENEEVKELEEEIKE